jgi:hypothetical protein
MKDSVKAQSFKSKSEIKSDLWSHARSQLICAFKNSDNEAVSHADSSESKSEFSEKYWKNWIELSVKCDWNRSLLLLLHTESTLSELRKSLTCELKSHYHVKSSAAAVYLSDLTLI